jgi:hypothetical protein
MKLISLVAVVALSATFTSNLYAADKAAGSGPNPYSDCGIGAALFTENKTLAVTSNVIWDIGTTAVTSATASPETCNGKKVAVATFILESYDQLTEDTARGEGEHLTTLLQLMEVQPQQQAVVVANIRSQMAKQLTSADYLTADKVAKSTILFNSAMAAANAA